MKHTNVFTAILILATACLTFWASSTSKSPMKTPEYTWTPPTEEKEPSNFTMAIVNPRYANNDLRFNEPFKSFSDNLAADIEEAMTARGYSIRGPFKTRDEMIYNDKEESDLAIIIEINPKFGLVNGKYNSSSLITCDDGSNAIKLSQVVISLSGKINLTAMEPISGEKLWVKSVEIPINQTPQIAAENFWCFDRQVLPFIIHDSFIHNAVVQLLEDGYADIIDKIWNHIHPSEFERLESTIKELKEDGG